MYEHRWVDFKTISVLFTRARRKVFVLLVWRHVEWDYAAIADVSNDWGECIIPIESEIYAWNIRFDSRRVCFIFLIILYTVLWKGIVSCCTYTAEIRNT